ncbi:hypothetical protein [Dyadobacter aurulentus]|uniref:hypothetical protein n=1 Tax=Dyadobacter sp. UC 10 TaxID=2605428 RepID=UPI0012524E09|nr:hypothetical protein [Dyadobacter sp. UC 10]KAA0992812.1 hypothetical protein FXO21_22860 [Dyadobacter sp. UC 10]
MSSLFSYTTIQWYRKQLLFAIHMQVAAIRQALRDSDDAGLTESQINGLLARLGFLLEIVRKLDS